MSPLRPICHILEYFHTCHYVNDGVKMFAKQTSDYVILFLITFSSFQLNMVEREQHFRSNFQAESRHTRSFL